MYDFAKILFHLLVEINRESRKKDKQPGKVKIKGEAKRNIALQLIAKHHEKEHPTHYVEI